jgi:hypothetical protein
MLTQNEFKEGLAVLFSVHPQLEPKKNKDLVYRAWFKMFKDLSGPQFLDAVARFVMENPDLYPGSNFIAMIRQTARPTLQETEGDAIELAFEAVQKFGYMQERKALDWLKSKSPLVAASVRRFGYLDLCKGQNSDVMRGQLRAIFKAEKERSKKMGGIVVSAEHLNSGLPDNQKMIGLVEKVGKKLPGRTEK